MLGFGGKHKTATYGVLVDVGSGSVGVGIVKSDYTSKLPEIIFTHRVYMRIREDADAHEARLRRMREALFSACLILSKDGIHALMEHDPKAKIKRILVTCSSPWSHTVSRNISFQNDEAFKITEALIKDLARNAEEEISLHLDEEGIAGSQGLSIVERATVNVTINDYTIHNPIGLKGTSVALSHITGLIPQTVLDSVNEVREKILPDTKMSAHTYMLIMYCVMRDLFPKTESVAIIDVTGESTEIGIVEDGVLRETVHCPFGSNTLIREITKKNKGSAEDIFTLLKSVSEKSSHEKGEQKAISYLEEYTAALTTTIEQLHERNAIPKTMIITALPQLEQLFRTKIPEITRNVTKGEYTILEMQKSILDEMALRQNSDVFITIASRFFHKLHGCGEIDTL